MFDRVPKHWKTSLLVRNAGWMLIGQGISVVAQAVYFFALARLLGVVEYGLLVGVTALTGIAGTYSSLGFGFVLLRHAGQEIDEVRRYWGAVLVVTVVCGCLVAAAVCFLSGWILPEANLMLVVLVAFADCLLTQLTSGCAQVFQALERMRLTAMLMLLSNLLRMVIAVALLTTFGELTATGWACASLLATGLVAAVALTVLTRQIGPPVIDKSLIISKLGEGVVFALSGSTTVMYNDIDKALLGHFGLISATGTYAIAYRILDIAYMPIRSVHAAAFPRFCKLGHSGLKQAEMFARSLLARTSLIGIATAIAMFVFAPLVPALVGRSFEEAVPAMRLLCLIPLFRCFHMSAGDALAGSGYQNIRLLLQACMALFNLLLNLVLIPRFSWQGAAFASLATDFGLAVISWSAVLILRQQESHRLGRATLPLSVDLG